ncbi:MULTISPECIES: NUDIX hydrolase [Acidocella]|uniref:NUDIX hydrolase n=2 Tax=Acidocellaceae TaxID=3385905 RepID=UPI00028C189A|nr:MULTISPECIES: NUDIX hydrolase [Acidocella]EKM99118.1 hypothetical protein MXAZACID_11889 [Acidocella sp. MX-AZ02]
MVNLDPPALPLVAALPYRLGRHGLEILLINSRATRGWSIPKGAPSDARHPHRTAEIEAFQQAGVRGAMSRKALGPYASAWRLPEGGEQSAEVEIFPLLVSNEAATWPEKPHCRRVWFPAQEAAGKVEEDALAQIIRDWLAERVDNGRGLTKQARGRGGSRHG